MVVTSGMPLSDLIFCPRISKGGIEECGVVCPVARALRVEMKEKIVNQGTGKNTANGERESLVIGTNFFFSSLPR